MNEYSSTDNSFLIEFYPKFGPKYCSEKLGRPYGSIVTQAHRLKLKSNKFKVASSSLNKICACCKEEKPKTDFGQDKKRKDGCYPFCKSCRDSKNNARKNKKATYDKQYRKENLNKININREKNREKTRIWRRAYCQRARLNPKNRILSNLRSRINVALRQRRLTKSNRSIKLLGCNLDEYKKYLESKFLPGMTWDNYGKKPNCWQIDHMKACSTFDLSQPTEQEKCFHYTNTQPLWMKDNLSKWNK